MTLTGVRVFETRAEGAAGRIAHRINSNDRRLPGCLRGGLGKNRHALTDGEFAVTRNRHDDFDTQRIKLRYAQDRFFVDKLTRRFKRSTTTPSKGLTTRRKANAASARPVSSLARRRLSLATASCH